MKRLFLLTVISLGMQCSIELLHLPVAADQFTSSNRVTIDQSRIKIPKKAQPILPLKEVSVGMRGYGLSVFHGTKIESFTFEIMSIELSSEPMRSVIWVRCQDERMQRLGPVSGMSGSPMYIWPDGKARNDPQSGAPTGGLLIGAFAYGYRLSKDCYVGVQPIELMRQVATRIQSDPKSNNNGHRPRTGHTEKGTIRHLVGHLLPQGQPYTIQNWQLGRLLELQENRTSPTSAADSSNAGGVTLQAISPNVTHTMASIRSERELRLPFYGLMPELKSTYESLLDSHGFQLIASQQSTTNLNPPFDLSNTKLEPGSLITVPLVTGDSDLSAAGTVTDIMPDGTVLAFGHAMDSIGNSRIPVATGYVHYVQPNISSSFKMSGSGKLAGTLIRDEESAIAVRGEQRFKYAPVKVKVSFANEPQRTYNYNLTVDNGYSPMLTGALVSKSLLAYRGLAAHTTVDCKARISFSESKAISFNRKFVGRDTRPISSLIASVVSAAMNNRFHDLEVRDIQLDFKINERMDMATLTQARLEKTQLYPGDTLGVKIGLQSFHGAFQEQRLTLNLPETIKPGKYAVSVLDAQGYDRFLRSTQPHKFQFNDLNSYWQVIQKIFTVKDQGLYFVLRMNANEVAVDRAELPQLPLSKRSLIVSGHSTKPVAFRHALENWHAMPWIVQGGINFTIEVRDPKFKSPKAQK